MAERMTDERLAELHAESRAFGLSASHGAELLAEVERLRGQSAVRRDLLAETRTKLERAQQAGREVQDELDRALTERNEAQRVAATLRASRTEIRTKLNEALRSVERERDEARAELAKFKPQPMSQRCRDGHHNGTGDWACHGCYCLCHTRDAEVAEYRTANTQMQQLIAKRAEERDRARTEQGYAEAERDRIAEQVKRVRDRHVGQCGGACATTPCECQDGDLICAECETPHPCGTLLDLDGKTGRDS